MGDPLTVRPVNTLRGTALPLATAGRESVSVPAPGLMAVMTAPGAMELPRRIMPTMRPWVLVRPDTVLLFKVVLPASV